MTTSLSTPQGSTNILDFMVALQSDMTSHIGDPISPRTRSGAVARCPAESQQQSDDNGAQEQVQKKRAFKKRKATHTLRKEEKEALDVEIQALKDKLDGLKLQALVQRDDTDSTLKRKIAHNAVLRDVVQKQHVVLARTQGMLVGCAQRHSYEVRPTEMYIHLTADRSERHETLKAIRGSKLFYARRSIQQRSLGMHPTAEYLHEEREDDDLAEEECSQLRLVTQTSQGVLLENNLVHFTDFSRAGGNDSYAVTTTDFVDEDELLPYLPGQRVRRDATTAILVTSHADAQVKSGSEVDGCSGHTSSEEDGDVVIVITRWSFTRICRTELNVSPQVLREMRDSSGRVSETMLNCVRKTIGLPR